MPSAANAQLISTIATATTISIVFHFCLIGLLQVRVGPHTVNFHELLEQNFLQARRCSNGDKALVFAQLINERIIQFTDMGIFLMYIVLFRPIA